MKDDYRWIMLSAWPTSNSSPTVTSFPNSYRLTDKGKEYSNLFSEKRAVIRKERAKGNRLARKQGILDGMIN